MPMPSRCVMVFAVAVGSGLAQSEVVGEWTSLVARAERHFTADRKEDGVLLLWEALPSLQARAGEPAVAAVLAAALALLQQHDPLHADRLAAFGNCARGQVDLAMVYRGKKWLRVAADCLDLADRFDTTIGRKERALLSAAPRDGRDASVAEPRGYSWLRRDATVRANGPWREVGDALECGAHPASTPCYEWVPDAVHEDCEVSVEFRSSDAKATHDCGLLVGLDRGDSYYHCIAAFYPEEGRYDLVLWEYSSGPSKLLSNPHKAPVGQEGMQERPGHR